MRRDEVHERVAQIRRLLDDLWLLDTVQAGPGAVILAGQVRVPIPDFEITANGRLLAAGYKDAVIEPVASVTAPWRVMITVPLTRAAEGIPWLNIALFCATVATTILVGGTAFAFWFLAILLFHEFGHFVLARRHRIDASWPYFIPAPNILGTFGALIRLRSPIRDRVGLFDMAVAGPLAGFVVAVIALAVGMSMSTLAPPSGGEGIFLGDSLLFRLFSAIFFPGIGDEQNIMLHPIAFAGWAGLLITMLNLLPIGQLDGGHIAYAIFRRGQRWLALVTMAALAAASFWWPWWLMWVVIGFLVRPEHPPTMHDDVPIGRTRVILGIVALLIFVVSFTPVPFRVTP
ncbi:MAG TPA: site-2 protease family protein [bacterium]|nr:site-2 protease family protein [bacterium]